MSNKWKSIYFAILAVLYFGYTVFVVGHGIHWTNSIFTVAILLLAGFYYLKDRN